MKANFVVHHDSCGTRLVDGYCNECKWAPNSENLSGAYHCPDCGIELNNMICPKCGKTFTKE